MFEVNVNKMAYTAKDPCPPTAFSVRKRSKKVGYRKEKKEKKKEKGKKFSMLTHATASGVGKNMMDKKGRKRRMRTSQVFLLDTNYSCSFHYSIVPDHN